MRQGQQNRRGRGRNRKSQNPLTRSFESNGPDVKIRGTPSHIAEKYMSLARDAHSSGDPVLAENYLQHAEHYNRIIMAYRDQQLGQQGGEAMNGGLNRPRPALFGDPLDNDEFDEDDDAGHDAQPQLVPGSEPQPQIQSRGNYDQRGPRHEHHRGDRPQRDRHPHQGSGGESGGGSSNQPRSDFGGNRGDQRRRERFGSSGGGGGGGPANEQPEFLRRPVRRPRRETDTDEGSSAGEVASPMPAVDQSE